MPTLKFVPTNATARQKKVRQTDTRPEMVLRRALHARGLRYRLHLPIIPRFRADIVFPKQRVCIFVDGCFWHGCPVHGKRTFTGPNASQWEKKMKRNQERDAKVTKAAQEAGWTVLRFWECEVIGDVEPIAEVVQELLKPN